MYVHIYIYTKYYNFVKNKYSFAHFHQYLSILLLQSFALFSRFVARTAPKVGFGNSFMPPPPPMPFEGAEG
jgi:hypothetical protein